MAPKRSAAPPPLPSPVASSEETASGSGPEVEEEEEEIAHSPPPTTQSNAPPPQKDQESEGSDEDEDGEDDDEEDEDDEEEEEGKANHVIPSATKNPPPPACEESETSDEEEEEEEADDEMPQTQPAPNQEAEAKGAKKPSQRPWSTDDESRILEVLAAHRLEHGKLPQTDVLADALAGKLDNSGYSHSDLQKKVNSLRSQHSKALKKGAPPSKDHDRRRFDLAKNVWPSVTKAATKPVANGGAGREPDEMSKLYPYLAEEVKALEKAHPGLFKREFGMIDDGKARALDKKIRRERLSQMRRHLHRHALIKEVTKTLMDLTE